MHLGPLPAIDLVYILIRFLRAVGHLLWQQNHATQSAGNITHDRSILGYPKLNGVAFAALIYRVQNIIRRPDYMGLQLRGRRLLGVRR